MKKLKEEYGVFEGVFKLFSQIANTKNLEKADLDELLKFIKLVKKTRANTITSVKTSMRSFESNIDELVEATIGNADEEKPRLNKLAQSVREKLILTIRRVEEIVKHNAEERIPMVEKAFKKKIAIFKENVRTFNKKVEKQKVPEKVYLLLQNAVFGEHDGDFGDRGAPMEQQLLAIIPDPSKFNVEPYSGKMKAGHHYEEYVKRILIAEVFNKRKAPILEAIQQHDR